MTSAVETNPFQVAVVEDNGEIRANLGQRIGGNPALRLLRLTPRETEVLQQLARGSLSAQPDMPNPKLETRNPKQIQTPKVSMLQTLALLAGLGAAGLASAAPLSDPAVDSYGVRVGTETFAGLYKFTTNTLLVETAEAITNLGSDTIKFYMGHNTSGQSGMTLGPSITNLLTLARDEPSYRRVLDMPFRHLIMWEYPFSNPDAPFQDGNYTSTEQANDYREMYDLTRYFLTNYDGSGKTFYLGHWEGDGYLSVNNWTTNPSAAVVSGMILWENTRQKAVDDAKASTSYSNVNVFYYAEANRVRDAMLNGPTNNVRMINAVIPYVTNLDYVSYSSYDGMNLSAADLYTTLNYMQAHLPPSKAGVVPGERMWIGEYGWGGYTTDVQEPLNRSYIQRLLGWNSGGHCLQFILFWEIYDNEVGRNFCLIDSNHVQVASWSLHQRFINRARLLIAQFKETNNRLPTDTEFSSLMIPLLNQPLPPPVNLTVAHGGVTGVTTTSATVAGTVAQGVYGSDQATLWVFCGSQDGGTVRADWQQAIRLAVNTNFNPVHLSTTLTNLAPGANYFYRFYATNAAGEAWAPASAAFTTALDSQGFGSQMKIVLSGYTRGEALTNFPVLVTLGPSQPGFSYRQFASPTGGDLRFTDSSGTVPVFHEIDEWNTNGVSSVWVRLPVLASASDFIWAYWGNPGATNPPSYATNGLVWTPDYYAVYHLKESGFPYADSAQQHAAQPGVAPASGPGVIGKGCAFDGSSQYLDAGAFDLGDAFTVSAWFNISPTLSGNGMVAIWANKPGGWNANGIALFVNSWGTTDRSVRLETGDGSGGVAAYSATNAVTFGQWHLLTAVVNRPAGTARVYLDGTDCTQGGAAWTAFATANDINLGRVLSSSTYFEGSLDEARLESTTRSANWVWASWMTVASNVVFAAASAVNRQPPTLDLAEGVGGRLLSWPASGVGFTLSSATNLLPPVVWNPVANTPTLVSNQWQISLPPDSLAARYYRLQAQ